MVWKENFNMYNKFKNNNLQVNCIKKNKKIYKNIQNEMISKKIKQIEIADKIGITSATLSEQLKKLSNGKSILTETLFKFADGLGVEVAELLR